jgi:hypothetical protein
MSIVLKVYQLASAQRLAMISSQVFWNKLIGPQILSMGSFIRNLSTQTGDSISNSPLIFIDLPTF